MNPFSGKDDPAFFSQFEENSSFFAWLRYNFEANPSIPYEKATQPLDDRINRK